MWMWIKQQMRGKQVKLRRGQDAVKAKDSGPGFATASSASSFRAPAMLRPAHFSFSSCARVRTCRALSTTPARAAFERAVGEPVLEDEDEDGGLGRRRRSAGKNAGPTVPTLNEWLKGEGAQFKEPRKPRNWLGGDVVRCACPL
jgi:hypothetical protein